MSETRNIMIRQNHPVEAWEKMKRAQKHTLETPGDIKEFLLHSEKQLIPTSYDTMVLVWVERNSCR